MCVFGFLKDQGIISKSHSPLLILADTKEDAYAKLKRLNYSKDMLAEIKLYHGTKAVKEFAKLDDSFFCVTNTFKQPDKEAISKIIRNKHNFNQKGTVTLFGIMNNEGKLLTINDKPFLIFEPDISYVQYDIPFQISKENLPKLNIVPIGLRHKNKSITTRI